MIDKNNTPNVYFSRLWSAILMIIGYSNMEWYQIAVMLEPQLIIFVKCHRSQYNVIIQCKIYWRGWNNNFTLIPSPFYHYQTTFIEYVLFSPVSITWTPQAMQGPNEWLTRKTSTGLAGSTTGTPTNACSNGPGILSVNRGPRFQQVGITIW